MTSPVVVDLKAHRDACWAALNAAHDALREKPSDETVRLYVDALNDFKLAFLAHANEVFVRLNAGRAR